MNEKDRFIIKVWPRISDFFDRFGSANYDGFLGSVKLGWHGPYIWSENGDTLRIITKFCEDEFGFLNVHNESKIDRLMFANFNENKGWKSIDIDITDASGCKSYEEFRNLTHTLFIEIKQITKGMIFNDPKKKMDSFQYDCVKLREQLRKNRCKYAIAILIDDGDLKGNPYVPKSFIENIKNSFPSVEILVWQKNVAK
jgi:hypothetical protein